MTNKNSKLPSVTGWSNGDVLSAADLNDSLFGFAGQDTTGGSSTSNTETRVSQTTITANTVTHGIIVLVDLRMHSGSGTASNCTFNLRVGTDATTTTNNALVHSIVGNFAGGTGDVRNAISGLSAYYTGATWSSTNYVDVTVTLATNAAGTGEVERVTVLYW